MKKSMCVSLDHEMYHKLHVIHAVRKEFFKESDVTMSSIIHDALTEYFAKHSEEVDEIMKKYHADGGCFDL